MIDLLFINYNFMFAVKFGHPEQRQKLIDSVLRVMG